MKKVRFSILIVVAICMQSCCTIIPIFDRNWHRSTVTVECDPPSTEILYSSGKVAGRGSVRLSFDCQDKKTTYYKMSFQAEGYYPKTVSFYNRRYDYKEKVTLEKKKVVYVPVSITPSFANAYWSNGNLAGTGNFSVGFYEDAKSDSYVELTINAKNYYSQTVKVYKSDSRKNITLQRKTDVNVDVYVEPNDAQILDAKGGFLGRGHCKVVFEPDAPSSAEQRIVVPESAYYKSKTVTIRKSDGRKTIYLERKPIKHIEVDPIEAEIVLEGYPVGAGSYDIDFTNRQGSIAATFSAPGYETQRVSLFAGEPWDETFKLMVDAVYGETVSDDDIQAYLNKRVPLVPDKKLSKDEVWRRLVRATRDAFEEIPIFDAKVGWIRTEKVYKVIGDKEVMTQLEIMEDPSTEYLQYGVKLTTKRREKGAGDEDWVDYNRVLIQYKDLMSNLRKSVKGL